MDGTFGERKKSPRKQALIIVLLVFIAIGIIFALIFSWDYIVAKSTYSGRMLDGKYYRPGYNDEHNNMDIEGKQWDSVVDTLGVDDSVKDSHNTFVSDALRTTTTASASTIREAVDEGSWMGLRRPNYDGVVIGDSARVVPSTYPEQLPKYSTYTL